MSQQPPQWSPQAVQIFTAARQITDPQSQYQYVTQACGPNAQLRWEVDWLLQWERTQTPGATASSTSNQQPVFSTASSPVATYPLPLAAVATKNPSRRGYWIAAIATVVALVIGFLGLFAYGAYLGVRQMGFEREATSIEASAQAYLNQRDYDAAAKQYERLTELRKRQYGEQHSKVSESIADSASCWYWSREYEKAAKQYEQAYQLDLKRLGPKHKDTLTNQEYWAICIRESDDYLRALEIFNQALAIRKETMGPTNPDTLESMLSVAYCQQAMGQSASALDIYEPVFETTTKKYSIFPQDSLGTLDAMLDCYDDLGRYDEARKLLAKAYEGVKRTHGLDSAETTQIREWLSSRLTKDKDWDALKGIQQELVNDLQSRLGADQPETLSAKVDLAKILIDLGQPDQGIALLVECRDLYKKAQGDQGDDFMACLHKLADAYRTTNTPEKGVEEFQTLYEERKQKLGPQSAATLEVAAQVGWRQILAKKAADGESVMQKALSQATDSLGLQNETTQRIASALAEHYRVTRQFAKEVEIRRQLAQQLQKSSGMEESSTRVMLEEQADAELESGNTIVAIDLYRRLFDFETNRSGPTGGATLNHARSLIRSYMRVKEHQKAADLCDEILAKLRRSVEVNYSASWNAADLGMLTARFGDAARSCEFFEHSTNTRPTFGYGSEPDFERKCSLWPAQAAAAKRYEQSTATLQAKLDAITKLAGQDFFLARSLRRQLAMQREAAGNVEEAEKALHDLEANLREKSIGWHSQALYDLGSLLRRRGKLDEAAEMLQAALNSKQRIEARDIEPDPDARITSIADVKLELALLSIAQSKLADAETQLLSIEDAKAKLNFRDEDFWDVRCRAHALKLLIDVQTKLGKSEQIESWNAVLHSLEATYPGATSI